MPPPASWNCPGDLELKDSTAKFARTLGLLLKSGLPIVPALNIARASATNLIVPEGIDRAVAALSDGSTLAPALAGTVPPLALQMIAVGEESSRLEELCFRVADTYDGEVRRPLRTALALIEPALILLRRARRFRRARDAPGDLRHQLQGVLSGRRCNDLAASERATPA